ncbi:MAG: hypothetical protein ACJATF_002935, partial [Flavobacteriales bacterium]
CIFNSILTGQSLLIDGTEWHYNMTLFNGLEVKSNKFTISGDTIIENISCKILEREYWSCDQREYHEFLYEEDNKVYFYDSENSTFKMLYDYDMEMGEEKEFEFWPDTGYSNYFIRIDAIDTLEINNRDFKRFTVSYGIMGNQEIDYFLIDQEIIEQIGSKTNYFHFADTGLCDWQYNRSLRCFNSVETNTINYDSIECDVDYFIISNSNIDASKSEEMIVYPNPTNGKFQISILAEMPDALINVYSTSGVLVSSFTQMNSSSNINIDFLESGMYFLEIINGDQKYNPSNIVLIK